MIYPPHSSCLFISPSPLPPLPPVQQRRPVRPSSPTTTPSASKSPLKRPRRNTPPPSPHRVALRLQYDGTLFHGWERKQRSLPTVQGAVEEALSHVFHTDISIHASSRTDAGAHALSQVIHFDVPFHLSSSPSAFCHALNTRLPPSIHITHASIDIPSTFDARHDVLFRSYRYTISETFSIFTRPFSWYLPPSSSSSSSSLDVTAMNDAIAILPTVSNLAAFRKSRAQATHTDIHVSSARVTRRNAAVHVHVTAQWFVYGMMRLLTGTLVQVGRGTLSVDDFHRIVAHGDRARVTFGAPAKGLCLVDVDYGCKNPFPDDDEEEEEEDEEEDEDEEEGKRVSVENGEWEYEHWSL